jgi:catechol 2,3-dioxygenase-like lactoylglutathione lyase family enzyme
MQEAPRPDPSEPTIVGFSHVATLTPDLGRYVAFYQDMFGARVVSTGAAREGHPAMAVVCIGADATLNVFEVPAESIIGRRDRIGERGAIDHYALQVEDVEALEVLRDRLVAVGASNGELSDHGPALSLRFQDPDGGELEVCAHRHRAPSTGIRDPASDGGSPLRSPPE